MGCYLIGTRSLAVDSMRKTEGELRPEGSTYLERVGGRWRDFPLMPSDYKPTLEEAADLEIRRAMRMGLDGFSVDVLAGQQDALNAIDALFQAAETHHYPFEITFCLDNPEQNLKAIQHLIEKHGKSPNLARRDGKVLLLGYRCHRMGERLRPDLPKADWFTPQGVQIYGDAIKELEKIAGEPLYAQFDLNGYLDSAPPKQAGDPEFWHSIMAAFAKNFGGVSGFFWGNGNYDLAAKAAREAGLDWGEPVWYQYESIFWNNFRLKDGTDLLRERWDKAMANQSTLIQLATWNDYTEATHFAPSLQTGYAITELTRLMIQKWKTGKMPEADKDRIYLVYPPYPKGSRVYPFHDYAPEITSNLEVITFLTKPATVTAPGRNASWEAPAGFFVKKLPSTAGPVVAELQREGKKVLSLTARESITDRPFRAQHSLVAFSTEDERCWKEDFPANTEPVHAYYGDDNGNGLPNWFEMYYFGKLGDFKTAMVAKPGDRPSGTGPTNLQAYLAQTNPLKADTAPVEGMVWDLLKNPIGSNSLGVSTNPEPDPEGRAVWRYMSERSPGHWELLSDASISTKPMIAAFTYSHKTRNAYAANPNEISGAVVYQWAKPDAQEKETKCSVALQPMANEPVAVEWVAPSDGTYDIHFALELLSGTNRSLYHLELTGDDSVKRWETVLEPTNTSATAILKVVLKKGQSIRLQAETEQKAPQGIPTVTLFQIQAIPGH